VITSVYLKSQTSKT